MFKSIHGYGDQEELISVGKSPHLFVNRFLQVQEFAVGLASNLLMVIRGLYSNILYYYILLQ